MKTSKICILVFFSIVSLMMFSQNIDPFLNQYSIYKSFHPEKANEYKDVDGSPYLNSEFTEGVFYLEDKTPVRIPIRYNMYTDEMEFQLKNVNYIVGNPQTLSKISVGGSEYIYLPNIQKGGYFELIESGKCTLILKKSVKYKPGEGPKAITGLAVSPAFIRKQDVFYMIGNNPQAVKIENLKSVINSLQDQSIKIEGFIKQEKIRNVKKDNLIKIVKYYNSL